MWYTHCLWDFCYYMAQLQDISEITVCIGLIPRSKRNSALFRFISMRFLWEKYIWNKCRMWDRRGREWHVFSLFGVQRKEPKKKSAEKNLSCLEKYTFVYPEKKAYEIWEDKNNILYSSTSFRDFFSKFYTEAGKRAPKYFYITVISQIQLTQPYWKPRASKQTTQLPASC